MPPGLKICVVFSWIVGLISIKKNENEKNPRRESVALESDSLLWLKDIMLSDTENLYASTLQ